MKIILMNWHKIVFIESLLIWRSSYRCKLGKGIFHVTYLSYYLIAQQSYLCLRVPQPHLLSQLLSARGLNSLKFSLWVQWTHVLLPQFLDLYPLFTRYVPDRFLSILVIMPTFIVIPCKKVKCEFISIV